MERGDAIDIIREFCKEYILLKQEYDKNLTEIEKKMSDKAGIGLEFHVVGGEVIGIGPKSIEDRRKYFPLILLSELEKDGAGNNNS